MAAGWPGPRGAAWPDNPRAVWSSGVHLLATAIEEGRDLASMSGILAGTACRLLLA
jgi:hypothetical protein